MFLRSRQAQGPVDWLLVGLGNPGRQYENTRHNAGFLALDAFARQLSVSVTRLKYRALTGTASLDTQGGASVRVFLMKPGTYMNLSGEAVRDALHFYKLPPGRVLLLSDDVDLPVGRLRVRRKGSAGGHNGLKSVIYHLGTDEFPRVKIGVGQKPHPDYEMADWVLSRFSPQEQAAVKESTEDAAKAAQLLLTQGIEAAMERYNRHA